MQEPARRVFFAWLPDDRTKRYLGEQLEARHWRDEARLRWQPESNWHVTLRFVGDVPAHTVIELQQHMFDIAQRRTGFGMAFDAIAVFPDNRRPLVLAATAAATPAGKALVTELENLCQLLSLPADHRPWRPHMTLARVRGRKSLPLPATPVVRPLQVSEIVLMESSPADRGRVYLPLCCAALR